MTPKSASEASAQMFFQSYLTFYVTCVVFLDENWTFLNLRLMSAYDITEFLRTAYQPFAYCVPSKKPEYCVPKGGGVTLFPDKMISEEKVYSSQEI